MKKTSQKATKKRQQKKGVYVVLDGKVFIEDRSGKKVDRTEIPGKVVLELIQRAISEGLQLLEAKSTKEQAL